MYQEIPTRITLPRINTGRFTFTAKQYKPNYGRVSPLKVACDYAESQGFELDPWQIEAITYIADGGKRLLLNCHRQAGKSETAGVIASTYAKYRKSLVPVISPSLRQSGELFRKVMHVYNSQLPRVKLVEETKLTCELDCGGRVVSLPSSEATVRSFSAPDLIIEDEASRVPDDLHYAVLPMLAVSNGAIIELSTPNGKRGHFWEEWDKGGDIWHRIIFPATKNPRISKQFLDEMRATMGDLWYRQEFLCEFVETNEQMFNYDFVMAAWRDDVQPLFPQTPQPITGLQPLFPEVIT